jgi:ubiquinone/menaquinone biosynthesis C-methylase UbiE
MIQKGDTVIDATCGNGHDTLALVKMVADKSGKGRVYGMDIQQSAIDRTSSLLEMSTEEHEVT